MTDSQVISSELARVLEEHDRAYQALRWLSHISFARPYMLSDYTAAQLQKPDSCVAWIRENLWEFPARVRPATEHVGIFANLFASFFQTSFRMERRSDSGKPYFRIERNRDEAAGRDRFSSRRVPRNLRRKRKDESLHLKFRALTQLADEEVVGFWDAAREIVNDPSVRQDVVLWTWACELLHRAHGEPHGPAVHLLWQQMDTEARKNKNAEQIWESRQRIVEALNRAISLQARLAADRGG